MTPCPPSGCFAWENSTGVPHVLSRTWCVGSGCYPRLKASWSVPSTPPARWSAWSAHPASARAAWCARLRRWRVAVVSTYSPSSASHTNQVHFHAVARLLRAGTGVEGLDGQTARDRVRARVPDADPEDLLLLHDLLGIADPEVELPKVASAARRRRLTALGNAMSLAPRETAG